MSQLPPPFGPFQPLRRLGAGGMAETFVAVRRGPGGFEQQVCIKRILPAFESDQEFVESFLNEARTSAALRHGNIVQVLDFGVAEGSHYLALELVDGLDLRALLGGDSDVRVSLDADLCTLIAADLCAALAHAHSEAPGRTSVVHRDVSPSNVLVSTAGEIKLTDFGIARASSGRQRTATGIIKGKVPYMPPEYIERGIFDPRGDLFSLGVLLYETLAGVRPFDGHSDIDTIRRIVAGNHPHLGSLVRGVPAQLVQCIERLLVVRPEERYPSAHAVIDALPSIHTHRVRRRLADLVRDRLSERVRPADPSAHTLPRGAPAPIPPTHATSTPGPTAVPPDPARSLLSETHTQEPLLLSEPQTRTGARRPSARAWWALGAAACLLLVVAALIAQRVLRSDSDPLVSAPAPRAERIDAGSEGSAATAATTSTETGANEDWPAPNVPTPHVVEVAEPVGASVASPTGPEAAPSQRENKSSSRAREPKPRKPVSVQEEKPSPPAEAASELKIFVQPYGDVWVDGKRLGQAPVSIKLAPGVHEVGIGDGRPREKRSVTMVAGSNQQLEIVRRDVGEAAE